MIIHDVAQRSAEWTALRLGRLCASRAADMLATTKAGAFSTSRRNLLVQIVLERLTGRSQERSFVSQALQDGIDREDDALSLYEASQRLVRAVGFVSHDTLMAGCSPDGVIADFEGIVEVKSPIPATHLDYVRSGVVPDDYAKQIRHQLWITGARWCDFVSFQPDFPEALRLKIVRVHRDDRAIAEYEQKVRAFLAEVEAEEQAIRTMSDMAGTLRAAAGVA